VATGLQQALRNPLPLSGSVAAPAEPVACLMEKDFL